MGLFKGNTSPEKVAKETERLRQGESAVGIGGQVHLDGTWLTIGRKGGMAKMTGGSGDKRIPIANVTAVDIKEPGAVNGYITFSILGGSSVPRSINEAQKDQNSVVFTRNHTAQFLAMKQLVEEAILDNATRAAQPVVQAAPLDVADQLAKMAALRDQGVITEEEFAAHKAKLLSQ
jgi:hypothetical protein